MKPKTLLIYLIGVFLLIPLNLQAKTYPITWDPNSIEQTIALEDTLELTATFTSNTELHDVDLWIVPELQSFVSLDQTHFDTVTANTLYSVTLTLSIPSGTQIGFYEGTVHCRRGSKTIPQTLKIELSVMPNEISPSDIDKVVEDPATGSRMISNEVIVFFHEGVDFEAIVNIIHGIGARIIGRIPELAAWQIEIPEATNVSEIQDIIETLQTFPEVEIAEPNFIGVVDNSDVSDPYYPEQWALEKINAPSAWSITHGSEDVIIGIIDTGVDYNHEDLEDKVINKDANYICDFVNMDKDPMDDHLHGTWVGGIVTALTNNASGIAGVSWNSKILALKVADNTGHSTLTQVAAGISRAVVKGAKILNLSLRFLDTSHLLTKAVIFAHDEDRLVVASAGNENTSEFAFPASYSSVLAVGATDEDDNRAIWSVDLGGPCPDLPLGQASNYGNWVDIYAPGTNICSLQIQNIPPYQMLCGAGTSSAAPFVSGAAALVWSLDPSLTAQQVREALVSTANHTGNFDPDGNEIKRLNAYEAVKSVLEPEYTITDLGTLGGDYSNAIAINASGQVVGESVTEDWYTGAFLWENNIMTDLGHLGNLGSIARDINDSSQVVGDSFITGYDSTYGRHAFLWQNGVMTDLGTLGGSEPINGDPTIFWEESIGYDNNNLGQIVGTSISPDTDSHAFLITPEDTNGDSVPDLWFRDDNSDGANDLMIDLGTLGGSDMDGLAASNANGINDIGQIVGVSATSIGERHAVLWQNDVMTDLGTLGGTLCSAFYINISGLVVGGSTTFTSSSYHAFLLTPEDTNSDSIPDLWFRDDNSDGANDLMIDLGTLGGDYSFANSINALGQVAGESTFGGVSGTHAFLWENDVMWDLNNLIPANTGWELIVAADVNDAGQIVGEGIIDGEYHGFLLTPAP